MGMEEKKNIARERKKERVESIGREYVKNGKQWEWLGDSNPTNRCIPPTANPTTNTLS